MCIPRCWAEPACRARGPAVPRPSSAGRALPQLWVPEQRASRCWKGNEKPSTTVIGRARKTTTNNPKEVKFCKLQILVYPQAYPISSGIWSESCIFSEPQFKIKYWGFICQLWYICCLTAGGKQRQDGNFSPQNCKPLFGVLYLFLTSSQVRHLPYAKCLQIEKLINRCYSLQIVSVSAWQLWLMLSDKWKENHSQQLFSSKSLINYILMNLKQLLREPSEVYQKWRIALCKS